MDKVSTLSVYNGYKFSTFRVLLKIQSMRSTTQVNTTVHAAYNHWDNTIGFYFTVEDCFNNMLPVRTKVLSDIADYALELLGHTKSDLNGCVCVNAYIDDESYDSIVGVHICNTES